MRVAVWSIGMPLTPPQPPAATPIHTPSSVTVLPPSALLAFTAWPSRRLRLAILGQKAEVQKNSAVAPWDASAIAQRRSIFDSAVHQIQTKPKRRRLGARAEMHHDDRRI